MTERDYVEQLLLDKWLIEIAERRDDYMLKRFQEKFAQHKKEYRDYLKKIHKTTWKNYSNSEILNYGEDYDSLWCKVLFKNEHWTPDAVNEFKIDNWIHYVPSDYDCTGQMFTTNIKCWNGPNGVVVYIMASIDV